VHKDQILERNLFMRIFLAVQGRIIEAIKKRVFVSHKLSDAELVDPAALMKFYEGYKLFVHVAPKYTNRGIRYREALAKTYLGVTLPLGDASTEEKLHLMHRDWTLLVAHASRHRRKFRVRSVDIETGESREVFSQDKWMSSSVFEEDLRRFAQTERLP
jgi:hypothetical protein